MRALDSDPAVHISEQVKPAQELVESCYESATRNGWNDYDTGLADGFEQPIAMEAAGGRASHRLAHRPPAGSIRNADGSPARPRRGTTRKAKA